MIMSEHHMGDHISQEGTDQQKKSAYTSSVYTIPDWLMASEIYEPQTERDTFVNKSILSVFSLLSKIKAQETNQALWYDINTPVNIAGTFLLLLLVALSKSFVFVLIIGVYLLAVLSTFDAPRLVRILKMSMGTTLFSAVIMLPAFLTGNSYSSIMIPCKVLISITIMGLLSQSAKWNSITGALKKFYIPDIFILILDIAIKYMYMLGELSLCLFQALKLRSVGKNKSKYSSLAGITGTVFLQSKEMAEDMYHAMECRGFSGEYHIIHKQRIRWKDIIFMVVNAGFIVLFFYFRSYQ